MVVQEGDPVYVEVRSKFDPAVSFLSDNGRLLDKKKQAGRTLLTLSFKGRGQKSVRLTYDGKKWTNLHFYCTENTAELIQARPASLSNGSFTRISRPSAVIHIPASIIAWGRVCGQRRSLGSRQERQYRFSGRFPGGKKRLPARPGSQNPRSLRRDCHIKTSKTKTFACGLSSTGKTIILSPWGHWTETRSKLPVYNCRGEHLPPSTGSENSWDDLIGLGYLKQPIEHLTWFETGPWKLECDGRSNAWFPRRFEARRPGPGCEALLTKVRACNDVFVSTPYPYSSELFVDQTAHEHVAFFTRYFGSAEKYRKTLQVIQALRGGNQPLWFRFGNDNRGDLASWYTESLNGLPLLGFETGTGMSARATGRDERHGQPAADGMGFGHFISTRASFP
jgi:hypothetical protein